MILFSAEAILASSASKLAFEFFLQNTKTLDYPFN